MKYNKKVVEKIDSKQWKCVCCDEIYRSGKTEHQKTYKHIYNYRQYKKTVVDTDKIAYEQRQKDRMEYLKKNNLI